jgi:hypothetical protein
MLGLLEPEAGYMSDDWDLDPPAQTEAMQAKVLHAEEMHAENMHAEIMHSAQLASVLSSPPPLPDVNQATTPCCIPAKANSYSLEHVAAMSEVLQTPPDFSGGDLLARLVLMMTDSKLGAAEPPDDAAPGF